MRAPRLIALQDHDSAQLVTEAQAGLLAQPARASPKFFYDALGSRLFDAITELDEYYPTRTEGAIFERHGREMAEAVHQRLGSGPTLVDLGAGSCEKAARLLPVLTPARYVAIDISADYLGTALRALQLRFPSLDITGVGLDFSARLALPPGVLDGPALLFYPGSSIGNFGPADALRLLTEMHALAAGGALLIGVDLVKPVDVLEAAYDDALGVTAAFNLNLLRHLNRLLGADFAPAQWRHVALFNRERSCIEMHLQARVPLVVRWRGHEPARPPEGLMPECAARRYTCERHFAAGERIHTEDSYKWTPQGFEALLRRVGFGQVQSWVDERGWFAVMLAGPA